MTFIRRVMAAAMLGLLAAVSLRLSGVAGSTPQHGGWRPLQLPDAPGGDDD